MKKGGAVGLRVAGGLMIIFFIPFSNQFPYQRTCLLTPFLQRGAVPKLPFDKLKSSKSYWILTLGLLFFSMLRIFKNFFLGTLISMILYDFILLDAAQLEGLLF